MMRLAGLALVSAVVSLSASTGAHVSVAIGPMRLVRPGFGYVVTYRTVEQGSSVRTRIRLVLDQGGRWRDATPPMVQTDRIDAIEAVDFVDERHGWVAAYSCATVSVFVYRTDDGGRSWQSLGKPGYHSCGGGPTYLSFVDLRHGWLEPVSPNAPQGELLATSNGGRTWAHVATGPPTQVREPALPCLAPIDFVSPRIGWMGRCELGGLFTTADGGRRWRRVTIRPPDPADARVDLPSFSGEDGVVSATIGTRPASENGRTRAVAFLVTHDGGRTWSTRSLRPIASCPLTPYFTNVWPASVGARAWWVVAGGDRPTAQVTTDGGSTWRTTLAHGLPSRWCSVLEVSAAGPTAAWVIARVGADSTALFDTVDGGRTWRRVSL
jgi:photosystem II stability/assembly factor-like uncharacterized protein